jgi:hypothetical protein
VTGVIIADGVDEDEEEDEAITKLLRFSKFNDDVNVMVDGTAMMKELVTDVVKKKDAATMINVVNGRLIGGTR